MRQPLIGLGLLALTIVFARIPTLSGATPFWPAVCALMVIILTRHAAIGLGAGVIAGSLLLAEGAPLDAIRLMFSGHVFPALSGSWHIGALVFTLLLGAFAGLLESSGGFESILRRLLRGSRIPEQKVLGSVYGLGLLCFFDGLANSMLTGRISREAVDRTGISREKLAWVVDSTSSPVACVAFISTWIATQLSLIGDNLPDADAYALYFRSIPGNPYCLLTLFLVPLAIRLQWTPKLMRRYQPKKENHEPKFGKTGAAWCVVVPLAVLAISMALSFQIWSGEAIDLLSLETWKTAASSKAGPIALVVGALCGLAAAWACHPERNSSTPARAATEGAASLLPALIILILAWSLGSIFNDLGAAEAIQEGLGDRVSVPWMPLAVFGTAAATALATGSSWGTMALIMPLALGVLTESGEASQIAAYAPAIIGAVFGGAVFGDHASPFSDTTIVSAIAAGCRPLDHVISQLPYAATAGIAAALAYAAMALGLHPAAATTIMAVGLVPLVHALARASSGKK